jgi:hypothetical protein
MKPRSAFDEFHKLPFHRDDFAANGDENASAQRLQGPHNTRLRYRACGHLIGEVGDIDRFRSPAALTKYAGLLRRARATVGSIAFFIASRARKSRVR